MIGVAIALIVIGLVATLIAGPFGFIIAAVGLALAIAYLFGFGKRAKEERI